MGYNTPKPPFNLAEFLSEKAPRRPLKRRFPAPSRGSVTNPDEGTQLETDETADRGDLPTPAKE